MKTSSWFVRSAIRQLLPNPKTSPYVRAGEQIPNCPGMSQQLCTRIAIVKQFGKKEQKANPLEEFRTVCRVKVDKILHMAKTVESECSAWQINILNWLGNFIIDKLILTGRNLSFHGWQKLLPSYYILVLRTKQIFGRWKNWKRSVMEQYLLHQPHYGLANLYSRI